MCKACVNNKTLTIRGEALKYAPWIIAKETGSEVLNKPTLEEIQIAKKVDNWYEGVREERLKANEGMKIIICGDILQNQSSPERRYLVVERSQQVVEDYLRNNNQFGLSDEVISAFRYRTDPLAFQDAEYFFNDYSRLLGIP
ncbi:hypothetical protein OCU04_010503 [Sclerotinia nivalis]|uniref:Uncharacterized protein n=1 Tax=Sclerotinia nivalis TaxID=352851 RepID=A0A9X0DES8_9HELO|nr:hypothetical protein OCU04_010503 [Sclerotinia nivalis]